MTRYRFKDQMGDVVAEDEYADQRTKGEPEQQVRSLFHYGLLAIASGPENQANAEIAEGLGAAFANWTLRIGDGFVPPWRVAAGADE